MDYKIVKATVKDIDILKKLKQKTIIEYQIIYVIIFNTKEVKR